ncbi:unnamed protein product [Ectocarpus sp. 12 AP-2014]
MLRGTDLLLLGCVAWCASCRAVGGEYTQFGDAPNQQHVSLQELTEEASKVGMEVIHPAEWMHSRRRLEYTGSNCWDVVVSEPYGICDGTYIGEGDRESLATLMGPSLFLDTCFEPEEDCGGELSALNRRMFMARAFKCPEGETEDCPKEEVWGVYSAITNATTGENRLGFLRAWADGALHPVDVDSQWWTFQYTSLEEDDASESRDCLNPDCLIQLENVNIECAPGSPNWTRPPSTTPYPSMAPDIDGTIAPIPTSAPVGESESSSEIGSFENADDLNGAQTRLKPPLRFSGLGGGGVWQAVGVVAMTAGWCAVVGSLGILGGLAVVATGV